jgi:hypothetical protein
VRTTRQGIIQGPRCRFSLLNSYWPGLAENPGERLAAGSDRILATFLFGEPYSPVNNCGVEFRTMPYPPAQLSNDDFISEWNRGLDRLTYRDRRRLLWKKFRRSMPRFLYKYRSLDSTNARSRETLREILVESVLRMAAPKEFNDPFDMRARFVVEGTPEERRTKFKIIIKRSSPYLTWKQHQQTLEALMRAPEEKLLEIGRNSLTGFRERTGVCCFAGAPDSRLMWSHYAKDHTGICLQFERVRDYRVFMHAFRVKYDKQFPVVNWARDEEMRQQISDLLFAKDPAWAYEAESRIVAIEQAGKYLHCKPEALRGIVLGCRTPPDACAIVYELLAERAARKYPPVLVYKATMHGSEYRLVIRKA